MKFTFLLSKIHTLKYNMYIFKNYHVNMYFLKNYNSKIYLLKIYIIQNRTLNNYPAKNSKILNNFKNLKQISKILNNYPAKISKIFYIDTLLITLDTTQNILVNTYHKKFQINFLMKNHYQKQVYNDTLSYLIKILLSYLIKILYIKEINLQICLSIMMKIIFSIVIKIYFLIMIKSCFLTTQFMKMYCLEITISPLIKKIHTSKFIFNAQLTQVFLVEALYALDFICLKYIPNKYFLILSVVINLRVMYSICCKKVRPMWFWFQVTTLICLKIMFLFFKWLKNITSMHSTYSEKYE